MRKYNVNDSFEIVSKYVDIHGGKAVYGVSILESDIIFEKQAFAVWESPAKTLHHITRGTNLKIMFIPNENPYILPTERISGFHNIFSSKEESCIKEFIENKIYFQELVSKVTSSLTEKELDDMYRYGNVSVLERVTNKKIEKDVRLKDKITLRTKV